MKLLLAVLCLATPVFIDADARAQEKKKNDVDVTEYKFGDDVVDGVVQTPEGAFVRGRLKGRTRSLIRVRKHYIPEMLKSVEDLSP